MNILVTGANGQLGNEIRVLAPVFQQLNFQFTDLPELDITSFISLESYCRVTEPHVIINCAAYTAVDKAESDRETAFAVNVTGTENIARLAGLYGSKLIHVSTDYVFDGKQTRPYAESDPTGPMSYYGETKLLAEKAVQEGSADAIIIRTSWLYSSFGNNFVKTILRIGSEREEIRIVADQVGTPTYAADLAGAILQLISQGIPEGKTVYHYSNLGTASWHDFAVEIARLAGLGCMVIPITTNEYPLPAPRPAYSILSKEKITRETGITIPEWKESLQRCINLLKSLQNI